MPGRRTKSTLLTGDDDRDRRNIRVIMALNGIRVKDIARGVGVTSQHVSNVIELRVMSRRVLEYLERLPQQGLEA